MKLIHHLAAVALAAIAAFITWLLWIRGPDTPSPASAPPTPSMQGSASSGGGSARIAAESPTRVRTLTREDRQKLREQIQAAIARRTAAGSSSPTTTGSSALAGIPELPQLKLEDAGPELQGALQEAIPYLANCYGTDKPDAGSKRAAAMMTMISDPELGTVIDSERVTDENGAPLTDALETCMRDAIESLVLPGLEKPGALPLQYTFVFD